MAIPKKSIVIYGPTTTGKMGLAYNLAKFIYGKIHIDSEIVNIDSRKIYKGFNISQSLPDENMDSKLETHLFGVIEPTQELDLFSFQHLVYNKMNEISSRGNLAILVGGSPLHTRCIIQKWTKGDDKKQKTSDEYIVIGTRFNRKSLKKIVTKSVEQMMARGLFAEFQELYSDSSISKDLLNNTLGYRQFIEMMKVSKKDINRLTSKDLEKVKKWIIKDILKFAYTQETSKKHFDLLHEISSFSEAQIFVLSKLQAD
jgi:tRNA A37 N6-isopentenylltransferase MiaA